jgi:hypothetical protein
VKKPPTILVIATLLLLFEYPVLAQDTSPSAIELTAQLRTRLESWDWFGASPEGRYTFSGSILRLGAAARRSSIGGHVEFAAPILLRLPLDAVEPPPRGQLGVGASYAVANQETRAAGLFLKQAQLRVGAAPGNAGHSVRAGRFEFVDGAEVALSDPVLAAAKRDRIAHRLIGTFGWSHVGRSFDGAQYAFLAPAWHATAVVARPTQGVFRVNGWPNLDVGLVYVATTRRQREGNSGELRVFAVHYVDDRFGNGVVRVDNRPAAVRAADRSRISIQTLGAHGLRIVHTPAGPLDLLFWAALQAGSWGEQSHRAWAAAAELGFSPDRLPTLRPWLRTGYFRGSGDRDPADDRHGTFFQMLPTPRIYARFPFHNLMNLEEAFASLVLRPSPRVSIRTDARILRLSSDEDLWYAGGGAFEPGSFGFSGRPSGGGRDLATLIDVGADFRPDPRLTLSGYLGHARGGAVVQATYPDGRSATLGFLEVELRR